MQVSYEIPNFELHTELVKYKFLKRLCCVPKFVGSLKVNSVQEAFNKWFVVHLSRSEILQTT